MIKRFWKTLLLSSIATALPIFFFLCIYDTLPDKIPIHMDIAGHIDNYDHKSLVFFVPLLMLIIEWTTTLEASIRFKKNIDKLHPAYIGSMAWICATMSNIFSIALYTVIIGETHILEKLIPITLGVIFIVFGNIMPKIPQNKWVGFRTRWTLTNPDIWMKTNRICGYLSILFGFMIMILPFINNMLISSIVMVGISSAMLLVPMIYSYISYRKGKKDEKSERE